MKLHATLRRTLALLLVLIFAMSNIGLAEVAEQLVEVVPDVEPSIEEPVVEEIAPEEEEEADADGDVADVPEGEEPAAPAEPAQDSEVEPEEVAVSVAMEVSQIDETSLCAYETIEPEDAYEVSYVWERAAGEDGEWETLEADGDVYSTDAGDRFDYVYRCTAIVNGVSATSAPVAFAQAAEEEAPAEEAHALIDLGADFGLAALDAEGPAVTNESNNKTYIIYNASAPDSVVLKTTDDTASATYSWSTANADEDDYVSIETSTDGKTATIKIKPTAAGKLSVGGDTKVHIYCNKTVSNEVTPSAAKEITLLPTLDKAKIESAFQIVKTVDGKDTAVTELAQFASASNSNAATAKLVGISPLYPITWAVTSTQSSPALADNTEAQKWVTATKVEKTEKLGVSATLGVLQNSTDNKFTDVNGQTIGISAKVTVGATGTEIEVIKTVTIFPGADSVELYMGDKKASDLATSGKIERPVFGKIDLTAKLAAGDDIAKGDNEADIEKNIKVLGNVTWTIMSGADGFTYSKEYDGIKTEKGPEFSFTPGPDAASAAAVKYYQVTAAVGSVTKECEFKILPLPTDVTIDPSMAGLNSTETVSEQTVFVGGDAPAPLTLKVDETDENIYKKTIHWEITNNTLGEGGDAVPFLTWSAPAAQLDGGIADGETSVTLNAPADNVTSGTKEPVTFTVTAQRMPKTGEDGPQPITLVFKINIVDELLSADFNGDRDIAFSVDEIGQPAKTTSPTPAYATATASIVKESLQRYPVAWSITDGGDWAQINSTTGVITAKEYTQGGSNDNNTWNTADPTKGKEVTVQAQITLDKAGTNKVKATKKIIVRPAPATVTIAQSDGTTISGGKLEVAADTDRLQLKLSPSLKMPVNPTNVTPYATTWKAVWTPETETDGTSGRDHTLTVDNNIVSVDISRAVNSTLKVCAMKGEEQVGDPATLSITVNEQPGSATVEKSSTTTTLYPGSELAFTVKGLKADGKTSATWLGNLEWTLSAVNMNNQYTQGLLYQVPSAKTAAYLLRMDSGEAKEVKLCVPDNLQINAGATLTAKVKFANTDLPEQSFTFDVKNLPDDGLTFSGESLTLKAYAKIDSSTGDATKKYIAQGDNSAEVSFQPTTATKTAFETAAQGYAFAWRVYKADDATDKKAVDDYISVGADGKITVPAETKNENGAVKNAVPASGGTAYTIEYSLVGADTLTQNDAATKYTITTPITVLQAPKAVEVVVDTALETGADAYTAVPGLLPSGATVALTAKLVPVDGGSTAGATPTLSANGSRNQYFTFGKPKDAQGAEVAEATSRILTATPKEKGNFETVTITATAEPWGKTATKDIIISGETINLAAADDSKCSGTGNVGGNHFWKLLDTTGGTTTNPAGHVYTCANGNCTAKSVPVKHTGFTIKYTTGHTSADEDDVLWKDTSRDPSSIGTIVCAVCGFECDHTLYQKSAEEDPNYQHAEYVDGTHHVAECPTCGMQIKQKHVDKDLNNECDLCGQSSSETNFTDPTKTLIVGEEYTPALEVTEADEWDVQYELDATAKKYLTLLDPDTGKIRADKATEVGQPVELTAKINATTGKTVRPVTGKMKITVKNKAAGITITTGESGTPYVIDGGDNEGKYLHLTAEISPDATKTDLTGYHWEIDTKNGADNQIVLYQKDTTGAWKELRTQWSGSAPTTDADYEKLDIYVRAKATAAGTAADPNGKTAIVKFVKDNAAATDAEGKIEIEVLKKLDADMLAQMITFNDQKASGANQTAIKTNDAAIATATKLIQDTRMPLGLYQWVTESGKDVAKAFDTRYGSKIEFKLDAISETTDTEITSNGDYEKVAANDIPRWLSIGDKNANPTIFYAAGPSDLNKLSTGKKGAAFKVTATVTHDWALSTNASQKATVSASRYIWVIDQGNTAKFQYKNADTAAWTDIPEDGLNVDEGDPLTLRLLVTTAANKQAIAARDIAWDAIDSKNGVFMDEELNDDGTPKYVASSNGKKDNGTNVERVFTVAKEGASDSFTIGAKYPGMTITPAKINVKRMIHSITLDCPVTEVGAGERDVDGTLSRYKTIDIRATIDQPDTADTLKWELFAKDGTTKITDLEPTPDPADKYHYTISLAAGKRGMVNVLSQIGPEVVVTVSAVKSKDKDGNPIQKTHTIKIYQTPEADADGQEKNGLEIKTEKKFGSEAKEKKGDLYLTLGESTKITNAGWIPNSIWGSSPEAPVSAPVVVSTPEAAADQGKDVVTVVDGVITGTTVGTAEISISPYNVDRVPAAKETLKVHVTTAVDSVKLAAGAAPLAESYEISVNELPAARVKIPKDTFVAYRNQVDDRTGSSSEVEAKDATVKLVSDDESKLVIVDSEDGNNWELKGVSPGTAHIYGYVNENAKSSPASTVVVTAAAQKILFKQGETALPENAQIIGDLEKKTPIVLTAVTEPAGATGDIEITVDNLEAVDRVNDATGTTVTLTPKAAGKVVVTAKTHNSNWKGTAGSLLDPEYLTARVEILLATDTESTDPGVTTTTGVKIVDKQAIGPAETTHVVATGVKAGSTVKWTAEPATAVELTENAADNSVTVTPKATGKAVISASVDDVVIDTATIYLLTAPTKVLFDRTNPLKMSVGEVLELSASLEGYDFTPDVASEASGVERKDDDLYTFVSSNPAYLTVTNTNGVYTAKAVKKTTSKVNLTLTVSAKGCAQSLVVPVTIMKANKSFSLGAVNGSTLYMAPGQEKTISVTSNPKSSPANLVYEIEDSEGAIYADELPDVMTITKTETSATIAIDAAAAEGSYPVTVKAEGFTNHAEQSFTVVVQPAATEGTALKIAVRKVGTKTSGYTDTAIGTVTVVKNEKLQAYFVDEDGEAVAGKIEWTKQSTKDKKKATINSEGLITVKGTSGSIAINGSVNGIAAEPITLSFAKAPKVALVPNVKTRTVAVGEEFQLGLDFAYPDTKASETYTIDWTRDLALKPVEDEEVKNLWTFGEPGVTTVSLKPVWGGKAQTVKFTVLDTDVAETFDVPEEVFVAAGAKTIVRAEMDGYVNLTWLNGTDPITTKDKATVADKKIKVKTLANDEVQITAAKGAVGAEISVKTLSDAEPKTIKITVKPADTQFPAETKLMFDKPVITVGESTIVGLDFGEDDAPVGNITYSLKSVKGAGKVSVKNNVVTGKTPGVATVVAKLGSGKTAATKEGTIYVLPKAKIQTTLNPTKMGANESLTMGVTITDYVAKNVPDENLQDQVNTVGMLTVESNNSNIAASLEAVEGTTNKYELTLKAGEALKTSKGKYTTTTITLRLSNGQKKTMKIQVVEPAAYEEVYVPESITMALGTTVKLVTAIAQGTAYAGNYNWHFADDESAKLAEDHKLTLADGKLTVDRKGTPTGPDEVIELEGSYQDEESKTIRVTIAQAKAGKNQFKLAKPNRSTVYVGEKLMGALEFNAGVGGGSITWKSSKSKVIKVDKSTGLYTVVGPVGKYSDVSATVNGKSSTQAKKRLTVAAAPSRLAFNVADIALAVGAKDNLHKYVRLDGSAPESDKDYSSALVYTSDNESAVTIDNATGAITAVAEGSAIVTANTYNGLSARMLVVVGTGSGSGTGPANPGDKTAASIELFIDSQPLNGQTVTLTEGKEGFTPEVVVKNASGAVIDAAVTWNNPDPDRVKIDADGSITPLSYTEEDLTITAGVAGTAATASYTLKIEADPQKADNFKLEIKRGTDVVTSLLVKDGDTDNSFPAVTAKLILDVPNVQLGSMVEESSIEMKSLTDNLLTVDKTSSNNFKLVAVKAGTAKVEISFNLIGGAQQKIERTIYVDDLPSKDDISIVDAEGKKITSMKLGKTEKGEFHISLGSSFKGTPSTSDLDITVTSDGEDDLKVTDTPVTADHVLVTQDTKDPLKYTFETHATFAKTKFTIVVDAYKSRLAAGAGAKPEDHIKTSFEVEIADKPAAGDFEVTGTPALKKEESDGEYSLTLGAGESVTLKAPMKKDLNKFWSKGYEWVDTEAAAYPANTADADKASLVKGTSDNEITVTYGKKTEDNHPITLQLRCVGDSTSKLAEVKITYLPVPTNTPTPNYKATLKQMTGTAPDSGSDTQLDGTKTVIIGENEKMTAWVDFDISGEQKGYATNLRWVVDETYVTMKPNGNVCEFIGKKSTGTTYTVDAYVYYGAGTDMRLGTFQIQVLPAPTKEDLVLKEYDDATKGYTKAFGKTLSASVNAEGKDTPLKVGVVLTDKSAKLELKCANPCVSIKDGAKANTWEITWNQSAAGATDRQKVARSATLALSSPDNKLYRNFNLTIDDEMKMGNGATSVKSAKQLDPVKTFPNGFKSEDGSKGATAAEVAQNQAAITASVDAEKDTIELSGSIDDMATWVSEEYTLDEFTHNWYCLIIETGFDDISKCYRAVATDKGNGITEPGNEDYKNIPKDENGALNGFGKGCLVEWLPLDKAKEQNITQMKIYVNTTATASNAKSFTIDFSELTKGA